MAEHLGLDFGTTNSVLARLVEEPRRLTTQVLRNSFGEDRTPSAVALARQGDWLFGRAAKEADAPAKVLSVKRLLGSTERLGLGGLHLRPEFVAALLFRHLRGEAEAAVGQPLVSAVVTVPANSKGVQRNATKVAAGAAGLRVLNLINEPTAAAMAYGLGRAAAGDDVRILVYDFGGGTLDVTVLRAHHGIFEELASRGLRRCGGDDLDWALAEQLVAVRLPAVAAVLAEPYAALHLRLACEQAKIALSDAQMARVDVENLAPGVHVHEQVAREELETLARPLLLRTAEPVREALADAKMLPSDLDHVLLVGGTTWMPAVRAFVEDLLQRPAESFDRVNPMTCVAEGAAIVAGILQGAAHTAELDYQVCLEHSLCTEPVDPRTGRRYLEPVIEHGTKIPNRNVRAYFPVADFAEEVMVRIVEGNDYLNPDSEENAAVGRIAVPLSPKRPSEDCPIEVTFEYREDGLLTATARDVTAGQVFSEVVDWQSAVLTAEERVELEDLLRAVFGDDGPARPVGPPESHAAARVDDEPAAAREARRRIGLANRVLAQQDNQETEVLKALRDRLSVALAVGAAAPEIETLDRQLAAELMFFDYLL